MLYRAAAGSPSGSTSRGKPGQKLILMVEGEASTRHNISIPALGIDTDIPPKGKVRVDVTFPASGVLVFSCKFHTRLGMNGQLLVGPAAPSAAGEPAPSSEPARHQPPRL